MDSENDVPLQTETFQQQPHRSFKPLTTFMLFAAILFIVIITGAVMYWLGTRSGRSASISQVLKLIQPTQIVAQPSAIYKSMYKSLSNQDNQIIVAARRDLANRLNIQPSSIQIVVLENVVWQDTCLGAPKQSNCGVKVDVPGYKVIFQALGQNYEYHTGGEYYRSVE